MNGNNDYYRAWLSQTSDIYSITQSWSNSYDILNYYSIFAIIIGSFVGILIDSIIGATIQAQYYCVDCKKYSELQYHHKKKNELTKGYSFIDNNIVNLLSTTIGSVLSILIIIIF